MWEGEWERKRKGGGGKEGEKIRVTGSLWEGKRKRRREGSKRERESRRK